MISDSEQRPHQRLDVWHDAMALVEAVYRLSGRLPKTGRLGLCQPLRRCAIRIPSNSAEGAARRSASRYLHVLSIARGSLSELDTQPETAIRLDFIQPDIALQDLLGRSLARPNALIRPIERNASAPSRPLPSAPTNPQSPIPYSHD